MFAGARRGATWFVESESLSPPGKDRLLPPVYPAEVLGMESHWAIAQPDGSNLSTVGKNFLGRGNPRQSRLFGASVIPTLPDIGQ